MTTHYLAQANFAQWKEDLHPKPNEEFLAHAQLILDAAYKNKGLVWHFPANFVEDEQVMRVFGNRRMIFNLSVWDSYGSLSAFVYRHVHGNAMREKVSWFDRLTQPVYVLWWIQAGHEPTVEEAKQKFDLLNAQGPSPEAFTFAQHYDWSGNLNSV
jgi:hypothetical protein